MHIVKSLKIAKGAIFNCPESLTVTVLRTATTLENSSACHHKKGEIQRIAYPNIFNIDEKNMHITL